MAEKNLVGQVGMLLTIYAGELQKYNIISSMQYLRIVTFPYFQNITLENVLLSLDIPSYIRRRRLRMTSSPNTQTTRLPTIANQNKERIRRTHLLTEERNRHQRVYRVSTIQGSFEK